MSGVRVSYSPLTILFSSAVERLTVNQLVPGSIPGRGVMKKIQIFPTPLHFFNISGTKEFLECKTDLESIASQWDKEARRYDVAVTTDDNLHEREPFTGLSKIILSKSKEVFDDLGLIRESEKVVCMWSNISIEANKHQMHLHANSYYSCVLYFNCPQPDPGVFGVRDPRPALLTTFFEYNKDNEFSKRAVEILPEEGLLIFFPSWLEHGVQNGIFSNPEEKRISLSANIMPVTNVTDYTHRYHYQ